MASRYFFALCALALVAAVVAGPVVNEVEEVDVDKIEVNEESERFWQGIAVWAAGEGVAWLAKRFIHVKVKCFPDVIKNCDINPILHPKKYYHCADDYFQANAERCLKKKN